MQGDLLTILNGEGSRSRFPAEGNRVKCLPLLGAPGRGRIVAPAGSRGDSHATPAEFEAIYYRQREALEEAATE